MKPLETTIDAATDDNGAFAAASAIAKTNDSFTSDPYGGRIPTEPAALDFDPFAGKLQFGADLLARANVAPTSIDPEFEDVMGAAFRSFNSMGALLSSESIRANNATPLTTDELRANLERDGLAGQAEYFSGVTSQEMYDATKNDLARETEDMRIIQAAGWGGTGAALFAGVADPLTLLPVGKAAQLAKTGDTLLTAAGKTALAATVDAAVTEGILQGTRQTQTAEDSLINLSSSALLGTVLGIGLYSVLPSETANKIAARLDEAREDGNNGLQGTKSAGAAYVDAYEELKRRGADKSNRVWSAGAFESLEAMGKLPGWAGKNLRNPMLDLDRSSFIAAHEFYDGIATSSAIKKSQVATEGNAGQAARSLTVQGEQDRYMGAFAQVVRETEDVWRENKAPYPGGYDDFQKRVAMAIVDDNATTDPAVLKARDIARNHIDMLYNDLVERGVMKAEDIPRNADRYFPLVHDTEAIRARKEHYVNEMLYPAFLQQVDEDYWKAKAAKENIQKARREAKASAKEAHAEVSEQLRTEIKANVEALNTTRRQQLDAHDVEAKTLKDALDSEIADAETKITKARDERIAELEVAVKDDLQGSAVNIDAEARSREGAPLYKELSNARADFFQTRTSDDVFMDIARADAEEARLDGFAAANDDGLEVVDEVTRNNRLSKLVEDAANGSDIAKARLAKIPLPPEFRAKAARLTKAVRAVNDWAKNSSKPASRVLGGNLSQAQAQKLRESLKSAVNKEKLKAERLLRELYVADPLGTKKKFKAAAARERLDKDIKERRSNISSEFDTKISEARRTRDVAKEDASESISDALDRHLEEIGVEESSSILQYNTRAKLEQYAMLKAERHAETSLGNRKFLLDHEVSSNTTGYRKFRSNPVWHAKLMENGYAKTHVLDILESYTRMAGTDSAFAVVFRRMVDKTEGSGKNGKTVKDANGKVERVETGDHDLKDLKRRINEEATERIANREIDQKLQRKIAKKYGTGKLSPEKQAAMDAELEAARGKSEQAILNERDRMIENMEMLRDFARGSMPSDGSSAAWRTSVEATGMFNFVRLMGGTVASALGDPVNIMLVNGFSRTIKNGITPMLTNFREAYLNANSDLRRVSRLTAQNVEMELNSMLMAASDGASPLAKDSNAINTMRRMVKKFSDLSGITVWNSFWKQVAANTTHARLTENAVNGWDSLSNAERTWMNNLGIDKPALERIRSAYESQDGMKTRAGIAFSDFDNWSDKVAAGYFQRAASAEARNTVITPNFTDKLALQNSPIGKLIWQFRSFMIANQMRLIGRNLQLASVDDQGAKKLAVYGGMFGMVFMGAIVDATKHMLGNTFVVGGVDEDRSSFDRVMDEWKNTPGTALYNAIDRTGIAGIFGEASNVAEKMGLPNLRGTMAAAFGDERGRERRGRFSNRTFGESALGPSFGLVEDMVKAGALAMDGAGSLLGLNDAPNFNRSDFRRMRRLLPGQNAPGLQQILNYGERELGTIFDWPNPH